MSNTLLPRIDNRLVGVYPQREQVMASWQMRTVRDLTLDRSGRMDLLGVLSFGGSPGIHLSERADKAFQSFLGTGSYNTASEAAIAFEMEVVRRQQARHSIYWIFEEMARPTPTVDMKNPDININRRYNE